MGQYRIPGPDCTLEGTARITDLAEGYCAPSATWSERVLAGSDFTPEEREMILDVSRAMLDLRGIVDPTGLSDLTNASITFDAEDYVRGWIEVTAIMPILDDVEKAPHIATHIAKMKRAMNRAEQSLRLYAAIAPSLRALSNVLDKLDSLSSRVGRMANEINEPLRVFLAKTKAVPGKAVGDAVAKAHEAAFKRIARENGVFIVMRGINKKSLQWIEKGFPSKGLMIKANSHADDGLVRYEGRGIETLRNAKEFLPSSVTTGIGTGDEVKRDIFLDIDEELRVMFSGGFGVLVKKDSQWVVYFEDIQGKKIINKPYIAKDFTPIEGHVIHMKMALPVTADYDLLAVINPNDLSINATTLVHEGSNTHNYDEDIIKKLNDALGGYPRILHGADERFFPLQMKDKPVHVYTPTGEAEEYDRMDPEFLKFMKGFGRDLRTFRRLKG